MGKLQYLAGTIVMILAEHFLFLGLMIFLNKKYSTGLFFEGKTFDAVSTSVHGDTAAVLLAVFRLMLFGWFCGFAFIFNFASSPPGWQYYTNWNVILISIYYMLASVASSIKLYRNYKKDNSAVSARLENFGKFVGAMHSVAGSAALMITAVNFLLLSSDPNIWNLTQHATTSISFVMIELPLNNIPVTWLDVIWAALWPMVYLVVIWPVVAEGVREWPYFFLEVDNAGSFVWYNILYILAILFFFVYYGLGQLKEKVLASKLLSSHRRALVVDPAAGSSAQDLRGGDELL
jgi:hypothetical protein